MANISVLNQEIGDEEGFYRIRFGDRVVYLTISTDVFDEDTMCRPWLLIPKLPAFPNDEWTRMSIARSSKDASLDITVTTTNDPLPEIKRVWHPERIDILSLKEIKRHRSCTHEVLYKGVPAISKIAAFDWQIPSRERETWAYSIIHQNQRPELGRPLISPRVLGHLTECGRVMGILVERLDGEFASIGDLSACTDALHQLHDLDLVHGDVNRFNFVVNRQTGRVMMVDYEHAHLFDEESAEEELKSLVSELTEETGRGGGGIVF